MKANVTFSFVNSSLSIELKAESEEERNFLALTKENMYGSKLGARVLGYIEIKGCIEKITFALNVPQKEESGMPTSPYKSFLC